MTNGLTHVAPTQSLATSHELSPDDVVAQVVRIQQVMQAAMKEGEHYGTIPGAAKPSLLKPGAEKLCLMFRMAPAYTVTNTWDGPHLTVESTCTLDHIPTGSRLGSGMGSCSSKESKYAYRIAKRTCPKCGAEAIQRSKYPPKDDPKAEPGWYCYVKIGGCNAGFLAGDGAITTQAIGRTQNPDLPDQYNTILKMSNKRALVAAVLNVTAASDIFTQDLEDYPLPPKPPPAPAKSVTPSKPVTPTDGPVADEVWEDDHRERAPSEDWSEALEAATSAKAHEHLKAGLRKVWGTFTKPEQDGLLAAVQAGDKKWGDPRAS